MSFKGGCREDKVHESYNVFILSHLFSRKYSSSKPIEDCEDDCLGEESNTRDYIEEQPTPNPTEVDVSERRCKEDCKIRQDCPAAEDPR